MGAALVKLGSALAASPAVQLGAALLILALHLALTPAFGCLWRLLRPPPVRSALSQPRGRRADVIFVMLMAPSCLGCAANRDWSMRTGAAQK
jgi:hypothetical protein